MNASTDSLGSAASLRLDGRVAIVTGAGAGLGRAHARLLASRGAQVVVNDLHLAPAEAVVAEIRAAGGQAIAAAGSVTDEAAVQTMVAQTLATWGRIDILVNNAGITRDGMLHKMTYEQWSDVIRVNMDSAFNMTRPVIEGMRDRGWGRIVNISSINGQKGQMGQTNYSAAKAGLIGFTKALALENAKKGVTVNVICPGYIDTEMVAAVPENVLASIIGGIPVGRLGKGEEIADMVSFLAGERAGFVTGATLSLNGGQYMA